MFIATSRRRSPSTLYSRSILSRMRDDLGIGQLADAAARAGCRPRSAASASVVRPDAVDVGERDPHRLLARDVHSRDTRHVVSPQKIAPSPDGTTAGAGSQGPGRRRPRDYRERNARLSIGRAAVSEAPDGSPPSTSSIGAMPSTVRTSPLARVVGQERRRLRVVGVQPGPHGLAHCRPCGARTRCCRRRRTRRPSRAA